MPRSGIRCTDLLGRFLILLRSSNGRLNFRYEFFESNFTALAMDDIDCRCASEIKKSHNLDPAQREQCDNASENGKYGEKPDKEPPVPDLRRFADYNATNYTYGA
jgi:hypothetical protein